MRRPSLARAAGRFGDDMTINEILQAKFGIALDAVYKAHGEEGVTMALRSELHNAAELALELGSPCGSNEVALSHFGHKIALLVLALNGQGNQELEL